MKDKKKDFVYKSKIELKGVSDPKGELFGYNEIFKKESDFKKTSLKVLSLFSGCGGLDLGFVGGFVFRNQSYKRNEISIVFANDIDSAAVKIYNSNLNYFEHNAICDDISNLEETDIPEFDFLIGGFPCQPFSNAGLRKGIDDQRGTLFEEAMRILTYGKNQKHKPKGFLFENVKGLLSSKMSDGTSVPDEIVKRAEKLGYKTNYKLIKSSEYGVPSNRERVVIIGLREDLGYFDYDLLDKVVEMNNIPNLNDDPYDLYLGSILCDIPKDSPQFDAYWEYSPSGQYMIEKIGPCEDGAEKLPFFKKKVPLSNISKTISTGRSWKNMKYDDMSDRFKKIFDNPKKYHAPKFYRRFALGEINGTITASAQPENCGITHPFENRRFSIREIARIQSFPDNFKFPYNKITDAYSVIGNAVPPILGWVIANAITHYTSVDVNEP